EKADLAFEFWIQQIIIGTQIVASYLLGIMPKVFRLVRLKRVEKSFRLVGPNMTAIPAPWIFDFLENKQRLDGFEYSCIQETERCQRAADEEIVITNAGRMLGGDLARIGWTACGGELELDSRKTFGKRFTERFS